MDTDLLGRLITVALLAGLGYAIWRDARARRITLALHQEIRRDHARRRSETAQRLAALDAENRTILLAAADLRARRLAELRLTLAPDRRVVIERRGF